MPGLALNQHFCNKKSQILASLSTPTDIYTDKSPKGSVDTPILELIDEINAIDGLVTTSSCSGRVSVFVEGPRKDPVGKESDGETAEGTAKTTGGPGGKGGGKWLFVSHEPLDLTESHANGLVTTDEQIRLHPQGTRDRYFTRLCGLERTLRPIQTREDITLSSVRDTTPPRLIHLSFSPLILHVLTATLNDYARPLLSAAINAGFRESGVQSLAALNNLNDNGVATNSNSTGTGTMVAIRTAGLSFETIIGRVRAVVDDRGNEQEVMEALVDEQYLELCFTIVNERFEWNEGRKERLRAEISKLFAPVPEIENESKEERRLRKREEGLRRQAEEKEKVKLSNENQQVQGHGDAGLPDHLNLDVGLGS